MSEALHHTKQETKPQHGTLASYIIGFVLSLAATLVPYYLIVQKPAGKHTLLATIIGFAVLQLVIQVVFFLHLGRERKPRWNLFFLASTIGIILFVVVGSVWIMDHLQSNMSAMDVTNKVANGEAVHQVNGVKAGSCPGGIGANHQIELKNNLAVPRHTDARLCDTITIINEDNAVRDIAFGVHSHHEAYAGEIGESIRPGRSMVITLTQLGTHRFHDHLQDEITGDFTVTRR